MRRTIALFGAGIALGAAALYVTRADRAGHDAPPASVSRAAPQTPSTAERGSPSIDIVTLATGAVGVTERAALFRLAAEADVQTIETFAAQLAALPSSEGRRVALEALLTRYAEIDAPAAADFARTLKLPPAVLAPLYATWARRDARAALRALGELDDTTVLEQVAAIWVERDVHGAIAAAEEIADEDLRNDFRAAVMRAWAHVDPDALLDYVLELDPERRGEALRTGGLQAFALVDPQRALRAAEGVPGEIGAMMKRAALMSLARDDPLAAISLAQALPAGSEREQMLSAIAMSYGRADPDAALAWAQSLRPPSPNVVANVLAGLARVDPNRAIDLLFETAEATNQRGVGPFMALLASGALDGEHMARIAERLHAMPNRRQELRMMTQMWAQRDPHAAVRWLLANAGATPSTTIGQAAMHLARKDPAAAIAYVDTLAPGLRATWISAVADGYAQTDARAAASWVARHRGEPGYDAAITAVATRTAASDPRAAARLFDSVDVAEAPDAPQAAQRIAGAWALQDPRAAASWASAIADANARAAAVGEVAAQWAASDGAGARGWALGLPAGAERDGALTQLLATTATSVDAVLVDAYSAPEAQQRGIGDAVRMLSIRDPAAARRLADEYLTDPGLRQAAERFMTQGSNGSPALALPSPPRR